MINHIRVYKDNIRRNFYILKKRGKHEDKIFKGRRRGKIRYIQVSKFFKNRKHGRNEKNVLWQECPSRPLRLMGL